MTEIQQSPEAGAVLDIGGDTGALLLHVDADRDEEEIHVSPLSDPGHRTHTVVRAHRTPSGATVHSALYPAMPAGRYRIVGGDDTILEIRGGEVTQHSLRRA